MPLTQLIYCSRPQIPEADWQSGVVAIFESARRRNTTSDVTGCLCFGEEWFLQVLEGSTAKVEDTYERIKRDRRHTEVKTLISLSISARSFPEWSMASVDIDTLPSGVFAGQKLAEGFSPESAPPSILLTAMMEIADQRRMNRPG